MTHLLRTEYDAMTISIGAPEKIDGKEGRRVLSAFYGELLEMEENEPYGWLTLNEPSGQLRLALGDGWSEERPPRWPDPEYPQQMHLDIATTHDVDAPLLLETETHRVYADPAGHPFCVYPGDEPAVLRLVHDCFSPRSLATFYEGFLGIPDRAVDTPDRVELDLADPVLPNLAFQHSPGLAPRWPDPAYPAQFHVDYRFPDGPEDAIERAVRLGAIHLQPSEVTSRVYADPAGHPFCF